MLHLPNIGKSDFLGVSRPVGLHLREIEGHSGHLPGIPPSPDQGFHPRCIDPAVPAVAGPLTPDGTADCVGNHGSNLAIEELGRTAPHPGDPRQTGASRHLPSGLRRMTRHVLPCFQVVIILLEGLATLLGKWIRIANEVFIILELPVRFNRLPLGEGLNPRVAVGTEQDSDRNVQLLIELVGKG